MENNSQIQWNDISHKSILSATEAALFLDVSLYQIYKLSAASKIPSYSPTGGKIYFLKSELEEWILSKRRGSANNIAKKAIKSFNN